MYMYGVVPARAPSPGRRGDARSIVFLGAFRAGGCCSAEGAAGTRLDVGEGPGRRAPRSPRPVGQN